MSFSPATVVFNNKLYVFHPGSHESGELWYTVADGTSWTPDQMIISGGNLFNVENGISLSPSAVVWNNVIYVFFQNGHGGGGIGNPGNGGLFFVSSTDGLGWDNVDGNHQPTRQLMNVGMSFSPSAVVWRNMIHVFHEGDHVNQQLWYSYHDGQNWQPDQQVPGVVISVPADAEHEFGGEAPMSPSAVVYNDNCYVFYLNRDQNLSYKFADGTSWSKENLVLDVPTQCGFVGCVVF
jgi:hypothetical protein